MKSLSRWLLTHTFALCAIVAVPTEAQQPASEAVKVAAEVLAHGDWRAEANQCPSKVMRAQETSDHLARNNCKPGQLKSCLSKCSAGEPGACYWLGHAIHQDGADQRAAEVLYQQACKLGVMSGCTNRAAGMSNDSPEDSAAQTCAVETFSRACAFDDPWACTMYAFHLSRGVGTKRDKELALKVLAKSCKYGDEEEACRYGMALKKEISSKAENAPSKK